MTYFPLKDLKRADYNPRVMPDKEMDALMLSIETHGFVEPIVVNVNKDRYGVIVGGHQRLTAIEKILGKEVPVKGLQFVNEFWAVPIFEVDLTLEAEKALNIALNKIHGRFEEDKLSDLILSLKDSVLLPSTGFDEKEISSLLNRKDEGDTGAEAHGSICARCEELKQSVEGHMRRSGHDIKFN